MIRDVSSGEQKGVLVPLDHLTFMLKVLHDDEATGWGAASAAAVAIGSREVPW
jgi:hypothetical protein